MSDIGSYDEDVAEALARETDDGPGFESEDELPPGDFQGEAAEDYVDLEPRGDELE